MCIYTVTTPDPSLPITLSEASGVPFYRQVTDQLVALIRTGALPPGTALPSVRQLAVDLKISVITTRRAYADLEAAGLVHRQQGRGTFVAQQSAESDWSSDRARELLSAAVNRSRELGLSDDAISDLVHSLLESP